nr:MULTISPECIES: cell division/cell wall cluster transcriptional repressor MraZ [Haematobacter]
MVDTFRGESLNKVDGKGRVSIPALFRRVLDACDPDRKPGDGSGIVLVYGDHRRKFIECYTVREAHRIDRLIARMKTGSPQRRALERLMQGQSFPTQVDDDGRLVLPPVVRERLNLAPGGGEVYFVASGATFQIWHPDAWAEEEAKLRDWLDEQPEDFDPLSLLPDEDEVE